MSYAAMLVNVEADGIPEQRVRIATELAAKFDAALIGFSARAVPPPFVAEGVIIEEATEADLEQMRTRLAEKGNWFRGVVGTACRDVEWRSALEFPGDALVREARCADLVIIEQTRSSREIYGSLDPAEMLLKVGRPVLLVPTGIAALRAEHVVVGWKDSREARRAVRDALPFLRKARRISVVEVCHGNDKANADARVADVAKYLARHRIAAEPHSIVHRDRSDTAHLLQFALEGGADLLVAGSYGHSRLGEWVFGGVTRDILASSPLCCLMSH